MDNPVTAPAQPMPPPAAPRLLDRKGQAYEPAVGPRLKWLLALIFFGFALLGASGLYMMAISSLNLAHTPQSWLNTLLDLSGGPKEFRNIFTLWIVLVHTAFGALIVVPFLVFGLVHWSTARTRKNRRAIRLGLTLFYTGVLVCVSGLALMQVHEKIQLPTGTWGRLVAYVLHVVSPLLAVVVYVLHRRAGPDIKWKWGIGWGAGVTAFVVAMIVMHSQDPRKWYLKAPKEGEYYFHPSATRTVGGTFVSADTFMMDEYCKKCHEDIYKDHLHSAHKFSSFNNPAYLFSVRETRKTAGVRASRWCAGCHDPVPFLSGQFDDPNFDDVKNPTAHAGISCTVCHAMTHINSTRGNGDYVIEEPQHYPFAFSKNAVLQTINNQLIKANPDFHKKTFLKPFHKTSDFCSTCHKVALPVELNQYKEFLRGQDHFNSSELSGVRHGARSFYYPPKAQPNCAGCHMPLEPSNDFGARDFDGSGERKRHSHFFPAANTGLPWLIGLQEHRSAAEVESTRRTVKKTAEFLRGTDPEGKDRKMRIDVFGIKEGGTIDGKLTQLRPALPALKPGETYLVDVVVRTVGMGHPFTQGTADSNEVWVDFEAKSGNRSLGRSGGMIDKKGLKGETKYPDPDLPYLTLDDRPVDRWTHFINVLMLDRQGNRINRRNPQDIFTPLYNHQIPPGAAQVVHYTLKVPKDLDPKEPVTLKARLRYRKFDFEYMSLVHGGAIKAPLGGVAGGAAVGAGLNLTDDGDIKVPQLPVVDICEDAVMLPVTGGEVAKQESKIKPPWQRWNDYGIACLIEGGVGTKRGELVQAEQAFQKVMESKEKVPQIQGRINLARVALDLGNLDQAREYLDKLPEPKDEPEVPWWTVAWLRARIDLENGQLDTAVRNLKSILDPKNQVPKRNFNFTRDYEIINLLGFAHFQQAKATAEKKDRDQFLRLAVKQYERTLELDPEDLDAHFNLFQCYSQLGDDPAKLGKAPDEAVTWKDGAEAREKLGELGARFADADQPRARRIEAALQLGKALTVLGRQPFKTATKRPTCDELRAHAVKVFRESQDEAMRTAAAYLLGNIHRELHAVFKPDDHAESNAKRIYRSKPENKADDVASQPIIIYPLR